MGTVRGFSLVEMLIVLLVLGILSASGAGFYANVTRDARLRVASDTMSAFFAACRARAAQRGLPVEIEILGNRLAAVGSPALACTLPPLDPASIGAVTGLRFAAHQTFAASGQPVTEIPLRLHLPDGSVASFTITW